MTLLLNLTQLLILWGKEKFEILEGGEYEMKKLMEKVLTSKKARNLTALSAFALSVSASAVPWDGVA